MSSSYDRHTRYVVKMITAEDGEDHYAILDDPDALAKYVRVNAGDAAYFCISVTDTDSLAMARIAETFDHD